MRQDKAIKYVLLAKYQAQLFSKDPSTKVAAIILEPNSGMVLSTGFNGMPRNINEKVQERWERPLKYRYVAHAEVNAICNAARHGISLNGGVAVVTYHPCVDCCKALIQSGITTVITDKPDDHDERWGGDFALSQSMFKEAGVKMIYVDGKSLHG